MTIEQMKEATIPFFHGFYNTLAGELCDAPDHDTEYYSYNLHNGNPDSAIYDDIFAEFVQCVKDDDKEEFINSLLFEYSEAYDHQSAQKAYCAEYASTLCAILGIEYHSEVMTSPKYYNYESDKIHLQVADEVLKNWIKRLKSDVGVKAQFADIIKNRCTSYDGFISSHSNQLDDYLRLPIDKWDNIKAGFLLETIMHVDHADQLADSYCGLVVFEEILHDELSGNLFSFTYTACFDTLLQAAITAYRDENSDDDYTRPLPSKYLKGAICTMPGA